METLQEDLMRIINKMIEVRCELPEELKFFYKIKKENHQLHITPFLTKEAALKSCRWYDSEDSSIDEDDTIIYREKVGKADFKIVK